jgi:hypothetical protein
MDKGIDMKFSHKFPHGEIQGISGMHFSRIAAP